MCKGGVDGERRTTFWVAMAMPHHFLWLSTACAQIKNNNLNLHFKAQSHEGICDHGRTGPQVIVQYANSDPDYIIINYGIW